MGWLGLCRSHPMGDSLLRASPLFITQLAWAPGCAGAWVPGPRACDEHPLKQGRLATASPALPQPSYIIEMAASLPSVLGVRQRLLRLPIFDRVLLGNSLVIVVGAVGGTLVTRHLAVEEEVMLIALFTVLGILLSMLGPGRFRDRVNTLGEVGWRLDVGIHPPLVSLV